MLDNRTRVLALGAIGVVFGDIGTSPLYAFAQCFTSESSAQLTAQNVLAVCSLIFWALIIVVCVKYVTFLLRADYDGQGGTLALLAQLAPKRKSSIPAGLTSMALLVLFGSAMLYGDGAITPAISVVSAVEGLDVWTMAAHPFIVPISTAILIALFAVQKRGTGNIGRVFGPVTLLWFIAIGMAGAVAIVKNPHVLLALNPLYGIDFFFRHGFRSFLIFGAVVLSVTGVEALYADLGHFGRRAIALAWYTIALPALVLNYFGQGANVLSHPQALNASFYALFPRAVLIPMVVLATAATIIASQALISGVFSLSKQAMQLGYTPRLRIIHTSRHHMGQIYIPGVNLVLAVASCALVVAFRSSNALGGAYGLAVTVTMLTTTIAYATLLRRRRWPWYAWMPLIALFLSWDIPFFTGNIVKLVSGGWVPLMIALALFTAFVSWNRGRRRLMESLFANAMPIEQFLRSSNGAGKGTTAIFLSPDANNIPFALRHQWLREHIASDTVIILTLTSVSRPFVHKSRRLEVERVAPRLYRVRFLYGFMEEPKISVILSELQDACHELNVTHPTYYLASPKIVRDDSPSRLPAFQANLYYWMTRIARPLTDSLGLPADEIV
ncbi:MAG TPA: KUP/HAK/KT family potassium transporter [Candidatus Baltobacteraceae bacterium]